MLLDSIDVSFRIRKCIAEISTLTCIFASSILNGSGNVLPLLHFKSGIGSLKALECAAANFTHFRNQLVTFRKPL